MTTVLLVVTAGAAASAPAASAASAHDNAQSVTITGLDTQAHKGDSVSVGFKITQADGSPVAGRRISLTNTRTGTSGLASTQPSGTSAPTYSGSVGTVLATSDGSGVAFATLSDTAVESIQVAATDPATGVTGSASVDFRALPVSLAALSWYFSGIRAPGDPLNLSLRPGNIETYEYRLTDANAGQPVLRNTQVVLSLDHGFFTPDCGSNQEDAYSPCAFSPPAAEGAVAGAVQSLGQTNIFTSDEDGLVVFNVSIGRDPYLDHNGSLVARLTGTASGRTVVADKGLGFSTAGTEPINGGTLTLVPAHGPVPEREPEYAPDSLSGDVRDEQPGLYTHGGTDFAVQLTDQYGNLISLPENSPVTLSVTGAGTLSPPTTTGSFEDFPTGVHVDSGTESTRGEPTTITATWQAPVSRFSTSPRGPAGELVTEQEAPITRVASFTVNFYRVDLGALTTTVVTLQQSEHTIVAGFTVHDQLGHDVRGLCFTVTAEGVGTLGSGADSGLCRVTGSRGASATNNSEVLGRTTVHYVLSTTTDEVLSQGSFDEEFVAAPPRPTLRPDKSVILAGQRTALLLHVQPGDQVDVAASKAGGYFTEMGTVYANANGDVIFPVSPEVDTTYQMFAPRSRSTKASILVKARQSITATVVGRTVYFIGRIAPAFDGRIVSVYFYDASGRVQLAGSGKTFKGGTYRIGHVFPAGKAYSAFAQTNTDSLNLAGRSPVITFRSGH